MKKIFLISIFCLPSMGLFAQSIEERVEALEFASYEQTTKVGGRLEYRFDSYTREIKESYGILKIMIYLKNN